MMQVIVIEVLLLAQLTVCRLIDINDSFMMKV
jgi:hypothetical protein